MSKVFESPPNCAHSPNVSPMPALTARNIAVRLGRRYILRNVNLELFPGEVVAIIGPSGCGKSTFITTLNGMIRHTLPSAEVEGTIRLNGQPVPLGTVGQEYLCRNVAMVFQRPNPFPYSIRRNMEFALKAAHLNNRTEMPDRIEEALRAVRLWDHLKERLSDPATCLSGGEQQRLCIARALVSQPDVILLDEPCSALDPIACKAIEELVMELRKHASIGIVTHNLAQAQRISDRCALFYPKDGVGRVIETGLTDDVIRRPVHPIARTYVKGEYC